MAKGKQEQAVKGHGPPIPGVEDGDGAIDPEVLKGLDAVDLTLPAAFTEEAMGVELLEHITNYHRAMVANKSARHGGDQAQATKMWDLARYSRLAAAIIQAENPGAKVVADEIARYRALRARADRQRALAEEQENGH